MLEKGYPGDMKLNDRGLAARAALAAVAFVAMAWGFRVLFLQHMPPILNDPAEDMSFALFVPVFSLYVLWTERKKVVESIGEPGVEGEVFFGEAFGTGDATVGEANFLGNGFDCEVVKL